MRIVFFNRKCIFIFYFKNLLFVIFYLVDYSRIFLEFKLLCILYLYIYIFFFVIVLLIINIYCVIYLFIVGNLVIFRVFIEFCSYYYNKF